MVPIATLFTPWLTFPLILCTQSESNAKKWRVVFNVYTDHMWSYEICSKCEFGEDRPLQLQGSLPHFSRPFVLYSLEFSGTYCKMCELWKGSQKRKFCEKCDISHFTIAQPSVSLTWKGRVMSAVWPLTSNLMVITLWGKYIDASVHFIHSVQSLPDSPECSTSCIWSSTHTEARR